MGLLGNEIIRHNDFLIKHTQLWETACVPCALSPRQQGVEKHHILFKKMTCLQNTQNQQLQISTHNLHTCTQSSPFHQGKQTPRPKEKPLTLLKNVSHSHSSQSSLLSHSMLARRLFATPRVSHLCKAPLPTARSPPPHLPVCG